MLLAFFVIWAIFLAVGISLWVSGTKGKNKIMTIIGAFLALSLVGLIIAVIQVSSWTNEENLFIHQKQVDIEAERLKLEQERLALEKERQEFGQLNQKDQSKTEKD